MKKVKGKKGHAVINEKAVMKLHSWPNMYLWMYEYNGVPIELRKEIRIAEL